MAQVKRMDFSRYPRRDLAKDETLFFEEENTTELYVLLGGSFGVFRNEVQVATIDEPLSLIGEMSALTHEPRNATVRALEQSKVVVVMDTEQLFAEHAQMGAKLARLLAHRLAAMNSQFVEVKAKLAKAMVARQQVAVAAPGTGESSAKVSMNAPAIEEENPQSRVAQSAAVVTRATATPGVVAAQASARLSVDSEYKEEVFDALNSILDWDMQGT